MKSLLVFVISILPLVFAAYDNELNKPHKDRYVLHADCEKEIHKQINEEMHASLVYAAMAAHFDHNSIARPGFAKFFADNSKEEREHAQKFIDYLNKRGSKFNKFEIKMPAKYTWTGALEAIIDSINLEKHVNNKLHRLHDTASVQCIDQHLMDFLENEFLDEQVESIDLLSRYMSILSGMDTKMGEYLLDRQLSGAKTEL